MKQFTLEYWKDDGWYVGRLKEMPSVMSQGETLEELQSMIRDAYHLMVEDAAESAFVGDIRVSRAINSMSGAAYWLPRYVGVGRAAEILLLGEKISARDAHEWGLLTRVFPDAEFESGLSEFMGRLATMPTGAIGANKMLLNYGLQNMLADSLDVEARELLETIRSADNQEGVRAFLEKRAPSFTGK